MASEILSIHPDNPEIRKIKKVADALSSGAVIIYPTDTGFTLGCQLLNKDAIQKVRKIRGMNPGKVLTFLCRSLANIANFAKVSNHAYRTIKGLIPGPYTFILPASKNVPRFAQNPKRNEAGIRVPDNILSQLLLKELNEPILSISAKIPDSDEFHDYDEIMSYYKNLVDIAVVSDKYEFHGASTIINMTKDDFHIVRHGAGIGKVLEFIDVDED